MARGPSAPSNPVDRAHAPIVRALRWLRDRVHGLYTALGLFLTITLVLAFGAVWVFAELASGVMAGATLRFDDAILEWLHRHATSGWDQVALQITDVGNGTSVAVITLVVSAFLWAFRQRGAVLLVIMAVVGADLGQTVLKLVFQRPRPELFVIQTPNKPFGVSWYQTDVNANGAGVGFASVRGIFDRETFSVSPGGTTTFAPTHQFHLGLWFNDPQLPFKLGCEPGQAAPVVTPFNGEQHAGIQVLNTAEFPDNAGPLSHVHR